MPIALQPIVRSDERHDRARTDAQGGVYHASLDVPLGLAGAYRPRHRAECLTGIATQAAVALDLAVGEIRARAHQGRFDPFRLGQRPVGTQRSRGAQYAARLRDGKRWILVVGPRVLDGHVLEPLEFFTNEA